jgi:hypothetical protein
MKSDHIKRMITLTGDNIMRLKYWKTSENEVSYDWLLLPTGAVGDGTPLSGNPIGLLRNKFIKC